MSSYERQGNVNVIEVVLIAAVVILLIGRRFAGTPVGTRSLVVPLILIAYSATQLHFPITVTDVLLILPELALGVLAGVGRGYTIKLYERDGHLWQRYQLATIAVWIAMIAARIGFETWGHALGASNATSVGFAAFGFSFVVESFVVARRAAATGTPLLPRPVRVRGVAGIR